MAKGWSFGGLVAALKDAAFKATGTTSGTVAAGDDSRIVNALQKNGNLSEVANKAISRSNLELGSGNDVQFNRVTIPTHMAYSFGTCNIASDSAGSGYLNTATANVIVYNDNFINLDANDTVHVKNKLKVNKTTVESNDVITNFRNQSGRVGAVATSPGQMPGFLAHNATTQRAAAMELSSSGTQMVIGAADGAGNISRHSFATDVESGTLYAVNPGTGALGYIDTTGNLWGSSWSQFGNSLFSYIQGWMNDRITNVRLSGRNYMDSNTTPGGSAVRCPNGAVTTATANGTGEYSWLQIQKAGNWYTVSTT